MFGDGCVINNLEYNIHKCSVLSVEETKTVVEHFELKQLEQRDRVLTVYRIFTGTQRAKIAEAIA
jgi:hypothetical protein